jgi:hypothetical protein
MGRALLDSTRLRPELSLVSISGIDISYAIVAFAIVFFFLVGYAHYLLGSALVTLTSNNTTRVVAKHCWFMSPGLYGEMIFTPSRPCREDPRLVGGAACDVP